MTTKTLRLLALALLIASCGGASSDTTTTTETTTTTTEASTTTGTETAAPPSPWDGLDDARLVALVREQSIARIHEADPSLAIDQRASWTVAEAPTLGDRVCEQMLHLAIADLAAGELDSAERTVRIVRAHARNRNNAYVGTTLLSVIARQNSHGGEETQEASVMTILRELPRARFGASTVVFQIYQEQGQIDAALEDVHGQLVSLDTAVSALFASSVLADVVAHRQVYLDAISEVRAANDAQPADPDFAFSTVDLTGARDAQPVLVAVWDTGTAPTLFGTDAPLGDRLFTAADGSHGVVSDPDAAQTGLMYDPGAATLSEYGPFLRGVMDLRAGMASTEPAQRVLALMRSATDAESLDRLETNLDAIGEWAHGSHVAGLMLAGLPQAHIAIFRSAWAGEARVYHHRGPTADELAAEQANVEAIAAFINANHVRVVNASLGFARDYVEAELRYEGDRYESDEAVRARAAEVQAARRAEWSWIFEHCPETLFVIAAGNSNRDVVEYEDVAASIDAPNLLVVGAVDRFGNWATFTNSNPEHVRLFDFGVEVDSVIPSGEHVPLSGTSMASPNAANLAAKMISVDPALTPARTIEIMLATGDAIAAPFNGVIANEGHALERVRRERRPARRGAH
jgi:subtilisin family serine protease